MTTQYFNPKLTHKLLDSSLTLLPELKSNVLIPYTYHAPQEYINGFYKYTTIPLMPIATKSIEDLEALAKALSHQAQFGEFSYQNEYLIPIQVHIKENPKFVNAKPKVTLTYLVLDSKAQNPQIMKKPQSLDENFKPSLRVRTLSEIIEHRFGELFKQYVDNVRTKNLEALLEPLLEFNLTFQDYQTIYTSVKDRITSADDIFANPHLLLLYTIHQLEKQDHVKLNLNTRLHVAPFLTNDQKEAVKTKEPFVLVQAGAGTGKSTTIIERIKFMEKSGIASPEIQVVSLTNAAANNIIERSPDVASSTIASYINRIYQLNYPNHRIVEDATFKNVVEINGGTSPILQPFLSVLDSEDTFAILKFVRDNLTLVLRLLNKINQTTLLMQSILAFIQMDTLDYGNENIKHFIVDETQDNNLFEFIYLLKLVHHKKASLYIVGDASQTLYEFRGASSEALNAIETTDLFHCIKLDINYRSNQAILDFANETLKDIRVNQFAQMQLTAPSDVEIDMTKNVMIKPLLTIDTAKVIQYTPEELGPLVKNYLTQNLERGEKTLIMTRTGNEVQSVVNWLRKDITNEKVLSLVPERVYADTLFTSFIAHHWSEFMLTPTTNPLNTLVESILRNLDNLYTYVSDARRRAIENNLKYWKVSKQVQFKEFKEKYDQGLWTKQEYYDAMKDAMISYEINQTVIEQRLNMDTDDDVTKEIADASILVSTVHSAKGLEFDHVIYLHRNNKYVTEDQKRIDYVALTRAKVSELIIEITENTEPTRFEHLYQNLLRNENL